MKYAILVYSNPQPWGHPTGNYLPAFQALPKSERQRMETEFDSFLTELQEGGELLGGEALGDPAGAQLVRWEEGPVISSGPYAAPGEHLAGMFFIEAGTPQRAEEILARFASPGETVELRPMASM